MLLPQIDAEELRFERDLRSPRREEIPREVMQTVVVWVVFRYPLAKRSLDLRVE